MKDKKIITIGVVSVFFIFFILWLIGDSGSRVKEISVGDYTLKLGNYRAVNAKDDEDSLLILKEDSFTYEGSEDEIFEITVGENELLFLGSPFFIVTGNDEFELEGDRTVKYVYAGDRSKKTTNTAKSVAKDNADNNQNINSQKQDNKTSNKKDKNVNIKETNI